VQVKNKATELRRESEDGDPNITRELTGLQQGVSLIGGLLRKINFIARILETRRCDKVGRAVRSNSTVKRGTKVRVTVYGLN
jgi:hypothetical protein